MARLTLLALSILLLAGCGSEPAELAGIGPAGAMRFLSGNDGADYARVLTSRPFEFPQDHASHPEFRSEWWYFTGNLAGSDGRRFGFELTFFRFALAPEQPERKSVWGTNQAWMAHLSLTDAAADRFVAAERFSREALGLAGRRDRAPAPGLGLGQRATAGARPGGAQGPRQRDRRHRPPAAMAGDHRRAGHHRRREERASRIVNELRILGAFTDNLPERLRYAVLAQITPRYFVGGGTEEHQATEATGLGDLMPQITELGTDIKSDSD